MASVNAQLIVVDDFGGTSAQPYYEALGITPEPQLAAPALHPPIKEVTDAFVLPVRSALLTPGLVQPRSIQAAGLMPFFLIGDDELSRGWLKERGDILRKIGAMGLVVNVDTIDALEQLRQLASGLMLSPVSGDDLAARLKLSHYPVLVTSTSIEQ